MVDPDYTELSVDVTVRVVDGADAEVVLSSVEQRIRQWLSPAHWEWGGTVRQFGLVAQVSAVPGVAAVVSASPDVSLPGVAPLPRLDDITVSVETS